MGRPKKSAPVLHEPEEDISQEVPDEEPARVIDENEADNTVESGGSISKAQAVRNAMAKGLEKPGAIAEFAKTRYGLDIAKQQVSAYKSQAKNREKKQGGEDPAEAPAVAPAPKVAATPAPARTNGAIPASLFDDLKQLRQMKDRYGDEFEKLVDAIG